MFSKIKSLISRLSQRDKNLQELLEIMRRRLVGRAEYEYKNGIHYTGLSSALTYNWNRTRVNVQSGLANFRAGLNNLESHVVKAWTKFVQANLDFRYHKAAYYRGITLIERSHLEEALATDKAHEPEETSQYEVEASYQEAEPEVNTGTDGTHALAFTKNPRLIQLIRLVGVYASKLSVCRLADRLRVHKIKWRMFEDLPIMPLPAFERPIRTNLLATLSYGKLMVIQIMVYLAFIPEFQILHRFAELVLGLHFWEAVFFPLTILAAGKLIAWALSPRIRRFMMCRPSVPWLAVAVSIGAFVLTMCYGFLTAARLDADKTNIELKLAKEQYEILQGDLFIAQGDTTPIEEEIAATKAEIDRLTEEVNSDPYYSRPISFVGLTLVSTVILGANSLLFGLILVASNTMKHKRKADKAEKAIIPSKSLYYDLLSKLNTGRRNYMDYEIYLLELSSVNHLCKMEPTESELSSTIEEELKIIEPQYQAIINSKKSQS